MNIVFRALTRKAMTYGVPADYFLMNFMFSAIFFIARPLWGLAFIPIHLVGVALTIFDEDFFSLLKVRYLLLPITGNQKKLGGRSYGPF